jgi:hypothetical protein
VYEDAVREEQHLVRRPVAQTVMQDFSHVVYSPVTSLQTDYVDQGQYVNTTLYTPGPARNRLEWLAGGYVVDPLTGASHWQRGGLYWVPTVAPGTYSVQAHYVPNLVAVQRPITSYVAQTVTEKRPVEVTSYVDEVQTQKVPVRTCRYEQVEEVRKVPYTVQKPVVERVTNKIPVQTLRWVSEEQVRKIPVTVQRVIYEEKVESVPVQVCKMIAETRTVQEPKTVATWKPYQATQCVPHNVVMRVPLDPCYADVPTTSYYFPSAATTVVPAPPTATQKVQVETAPAKDSVLKQEETSGSKAAAEPRTKAGSNNTGKTTPKDSDPTGQPKLEEELDKILPPSLNSPSGQGNAAAKESKPG